MTELRLIATRPASALVRIGLGSAAVVGIGTVVAALAIPISGLAAIPIAAGSALVVAIGAFSGLSGPAVVRIEHRRLTIAGRRVAADLALAECTFVVHDGTSVSVFDGHGRAVARISEGDDPIERLDVALRGAGARLTHQRSPYDAS